MAKRTLAKTRVADFDSFWIRRCVEMCLHDGCAEMGKITSVVFQNAKGGEFFSAFER